MTRLCQDYMPKVTRGRKAKKVSGKQYSAIGTPASPQNISKTEQKERKTKIEIILCTGTESMKFLLDRACKASIQEWWGEKKKEAQKQQSI